ncbi:peptide-methionine (S)-S-oxide reductase MsrA [Patescibacteria group bacterium]|nr:peptide-methionine (S)-S-oxide reductase MsrA [Patescibacteria group bacterium]
MATAVFGGGCFWCTEAVFKMLNGVSSVLPGYAGGTVPHPAYEAVCSGTTGHAECVKIEYDEQVVTYRDLLTVFFASHDPSTLNRQGNDVGTQYRSVIFYTTPDQQSEALTMIAEMNASSEGGAPILTAVEPLTEFYPAEDYHRDYYALNSHAPYCRIVINPKLEKVQKDFSALLKNGSV